jgi:hypothetical protein
VHVYQTRNRSGAFPLSLVDYFDYRQHSKSFAELAAHYPSAPLHVVVDGEPATVTGSVVTASYFRVLGLKPALGRFFGDTEDDVRDRDAVVVISHSFWRNRFEAHPEVVGRIIAINGMLAVVALAASGIPARRAMRVDPALTLRQE